MTIEELFLKFAEAEQIPVMQMQLMPEVPNHLCIHIEGKSNTFEGHGICLEEERLFLFYVLLGARVPADKRERAAEYLLRLNYGIKTGGVYMEPESGELTARVTQYLYGSDWEQMELMERVVRNCGVIADTYYTDIMKYIFE